MGVGVDSVGRPETPLEVFNLLYLLRSLPETPEANYKQDMSGSPSWGHRVQSVLRTGRDHS